jgi:hypothetical protein
MRILLTAALALIMPSLASVKDITVSLDLTIRESDGIMFGSLIDISTNSKNAFYVVDRDEKAVYKYSEDGRFLRKVGRPGQGPGEFQEPCSICVDARDVVFILDGSNRRIEVFDANDDYLRSIRIPNFPIGNWRRLAVDEDHNIYISGYYPNEDRVLSKFSQEGEFIQSFRLPAIDYSDIDFDEHGKRMVKQYLMGGSLCVGKNGSMYFSYAWPYLIERLSGDDTASIEVHRESTHNWTPFIFKTNEVNGRLFGGTTHTEKIFCAGGDYLVNAILVLDWEGHPKRTVNMSIMKNNPEAYFKVKGRFAVLDFYTSSGKFVESVRVDGNVRFLCSDTKGRILGVSHDEEGFSTIVRYSVTGL